MLVMLLLVGLSYQQCKIGCQKCASNDVCLLCDIINNYFLNNTTCALSSQQNCRILALSGNCTACNPGFYLDQTTRACVSVAQANVVANCLYYSSSQSCSLCGSGRFISAGQCVAATTLVTNCNYYSDNGKCAQCSAGFLFKDTLDTCIKIPDNLNCLAYTFVNCTTCANGFVYNRNNAAFSLLSSDGGYNLLTQLINGSTLWGGLNVCQGIAATNCRQQNLFNQCISCNAGYYLKNNLCVIFPVNPIFGCAVYSSVTTCTACVDFMYPITSTSCVNNTIIANCVKYSNTAATNVCVECSRNFFLNLNACSPRVVSITIVNCLTYSKTVDTCETCSAGTVLTNDKLACLPTVNNCKAYAASTLNTPFLVCSLCNNGWYITVVGNSVICVQGTIQNCQLYKNGGSTPSTNVCITCVNGFYLANNLCPAHTAVANCLTYSQVEANVCTNCATGSYPFHLTTICVSTPVISSCDIYNVDGLSCQKCLAGFYPAGNICAAIPSTFTNCELFDGTRCTKCLAGFMVNDVNSPGTCIRLPDYLVSDTNSFCFATTTVPGQWPTWNQFTSASPANNIFYPLACTSCAPGLFPRLPLPNEAICVKESELNFYRGLQSPRDSNCKRYGLSYDNKDLVCMECNTGFFISNYHQRGHFGSAKNPWNPTGITCVSSCALTTTVVNTNMIILDDLLGFVNICIPANTAAGFITNAAAPLLGCTRAVRITFSKKPIDADGILNYHFACLSTFATSAPQRKIDIKYGLTVDFASAGRGDWTTFLGNIQYKTTIYNYMSSSATTPLNYKTPAGTIKFDWAHGYPNTDTGPYPTVFNYKGILLEAQPLVLSFLAATVIASYDNCDVFFNYPTLATGAYGYAFITGTPTYNSQDPVTTGNFLICLRCAFGYSLGYATPGAAAVRTDNPPFPSCSSAKMSNCASSTIYGGLTTFLNTVFSCHQCASGTYPHIFIETDFSVVAANNEKTSSSKFRGWKIDGVFTAANAIAPAFRNSFDCIAVASGDLISKPTLVAAGNDVITAAFSTFKCAAFGWITPTTHLVRPAAAATQLTNRVCLACAANYFPTYYLADDATNFSGPSGVPGYAVKECTVSPNCDTTVTTQFNGCGKCRTDTELASSPTFYAFVDALLGGCVLVFTKNCLIARSEEAALMNAAGTTYHCHVCKAGFFMNVDRVCESVKIANMASGATFAIPLFSGYVWDSRRAAFGERTDNLPTNTAGGSLRLSYIIKNHYLVSASGNPYGVSACSSGWIQAPSNFWAANICVDSPYLRGSVRTTDPTTSFIANCARYQHKNDDTVSFTYFYPTEKDDAVITNVYLCDQCNPGFNLQFDFKACVAQNTITNCLRFQTGVTNACEICAPTFLNLNGKCVSTVIANCKTHKQTTANSADAALICLVCNDGFSRSVDTFSCAAGSIPFCNSYTDGSLTDCLTCRAGYSLLSAIDTNNANASFKYCYPIPITSNCAIWQGVAHDSGLNQATFSCAKCTTSASAAFGLRSFDYLPLLIPPSSCLPFNAVPNCVAYFQNVTVVTSNTFKCTQCADTFWLQLTTNTCVLRVNNQPECTAVPLTADTCTTCRTGWYLNGDSTRCIVNPPGIAGCAVYSDANVCSLCLPGFYLNLANRCIPSTVVPNCKTYSGNYTCTACADGWFLFNATTCTTPNATNCLAVASVNACQTCPPGSGFSTTNLVTSCVSNAILNCATPTTVFPFTCLVCNTGFFPNANGVCTAVTTTIPGCLVYDSATTCVTCQKLGILSVNRTSCDATNYLTYMDGNCQASALTSAPACAQCALGSYFVGETCTLCPNNGLSFGCLSCDPTNPSSCFLCSSGFYMNKAGVCIRNTNLPDGTPTDGVPNPPNTASARKAVAFTLGLAALYFEAL